MLRKHWSFQLTLEFVKAAFILAGTLMMMYFFPSHIADWLFLAFLAAALVWQLDSKWSLGTGLLLLTLQPLLLGLTLLHLSEKMAVYTFYLLSIGVIMAVLSQWRAHRT